MAAKDETPLQKLKKSSPANVSDAEWRSVLPANVYHVAREAGTERPYSSEFVKHAKKGKYTCYCCGAELFVSDAKFWSDCGWPAFAKSVADDKNIVRKVDRTVGMERVEIRCKQCDAHLGHVFEDGPVEMGGQRYCVNGCSLDFVPENAESKK